MTFPHGGGRNIPKRLHPKQGDRQQERQKAMSNLFTSVSNPIASNMVRKAALTATLKDAEAADRAFVMANPKSVFNGTTVAVIGTGFQIGALPKDSVKNGALAEWIVEWTLTHGSTDKAALEAAILKKHAEAVKSEQNGVPALAGGADHIRKMWEHHMPNAGAALDPIGYTPKAPNSSIEGDIAAMFVVGGIAEAVTPMSDDQFAALEAAYKNAKAARSGSRKRTPKVVGSATTVVAGNNNPVTK